MPRPKRSIESEVNIGGVRLIWRLHREQQWCTVDHWRGVSIRVISLDGEHRELFLEYSTVKNQRTHHSRVTWSTRPRIDPKRVEAHIRMALAAGWDPSSRGKPYVYQVSELPG